LHCNFLTALRAAQSSQTSRLRQKCHLRPTKPRAARLHHLGTTDHLTSYSTTTRPRRPSPCTSPPSPSPWILFVPGKQQWDTGCRMQRDRRIPCITEMQYCLLMREKFADGLAGPTWRRRDWMKVCHSSLYSMSFIGPRKLP
jgi:hypothetical protein